MTIIDQTLSQWFAQDTAAGSGATGITMGDALSRAAKMWGSREALVYRQQPAVDPVAWTYRELDDLSGALAAVLAVLGHQPGDRVAIWGPNHPEWVLLEYAIAKAGLVLVALNPLYRKAELGFALADSGAVSIFHADHIGGHDPAATIASVRSDAPALRRVYSFSSIWTDLMLENDAPQVDRVIDPSSTFMIQYTSGTSGVPKAVRLSHAAIAKTGGTSYRLWGLGEGSRVCFGFPLFHVGGSGNSIPGACLNGVTALPLHIFKPGVALDILERERCTTFIGVPTMLIAMLDDSSVRSRDLSTMTSIIMGGASVSRDLIDRCRDVFGAEVINCYGQTETCGVTTSTQRHDPAEKKTSTSGQPVPGVSVLIADDAGKPVPRGEVGEVLYRGPGAMIGYGSAEDAGSNSDGWIASGDLARMDADGFIAIVGRKKEMIIRGGENLSPVEIEEYMKSHPVISDVAVVGVPDAKYGEVACAVVRLHEGHTASAEDIRAWCATRISRWKVPDYVEFVDEYPMTPSGKIRKFLLQQAMAERLGLVQQPATPIGEPRT